MLGAARGVRGPGTASRTRTTNGRLRCTGIPGSCKPTAFDRVEGIAEAPIASRSIGETAACPERSRATDTIPIIGLAPDHPTATVFLDETGVVHRKEDRYFGIGCLKVRDHVRLLKSVARLREQMGFYDELH